MKRVLILGYGNPDRQDDGVSWHILNGIAERLNMPLLDPDEGIDFSESETVDLSFDLQLTPEHAERITAYEMVCFVDAHTGTVPNNVNVEAVTAQFQRSPFTHHMTPATCLSMAETFYGSRPKALVVSVRGFYFGFLQSLSEETAALVPPAVEQILAWINA